ncbi:hypothetical protein EVAR_46663_1 [Eumeta japonica]|uniref:Uncharacterized protein n=1 Tax=Eumeta variegata TaxID=151549 RepID=A0A4C1Y2Q2_EUMVA|nr:hypothetical protein EVAR_46663_1 [Eumeta japonica]
MRALGTGPVCPYGRDGSEEEAFSNKNKKEIKMDFSEGNLEPLIYNTIRPLKLSPPRSARRAVCRRVRCSLYKVRRGYAGERQVNDRMRGFGGLDN